LYFNFIIAHAYFPEDGSKRPNMLGGLPHIRILL